MPAPTTLERTLRPGEVAGTGTKGRYRRLCFGPGEARLVRPGTDARFAQSRLRRSLLVLVHVTDLQLADVASPGRFEFFEQLRGRPGDLTPFVPAQRPQEALCLHAVDTMARTLGRVGSSPDTGAAIGLAVCTGDNIDNAQLNELTWFMTLLAGGELVPSAGGPSYEGVQAADWPSDLYWHPDPGPDRFKRDWGFPDYPGLLSRAAAPFNAGGAGLPWLSCFGNHDGLAIGEAVPTEAYRRLLTGAEKPISLPPNLDPLPRVSELFSHPERFLTGPTRRVTPSPDRRAVSRRDFVAAHLRAGGSPAGHGYDAANLAAGTAYAAYDGVEAVRLILLDTTNLDGASDGSIGARQLAWLEERLIEVHSHHLSPEGTDCTTGHKDRLVVLASHHGLVSLTNCRESTDGLEEDRPRLGAAEVRALIHRFPNVVLWINGHRHVNEVALRTPADGSAGGFWEVSTAALADWPCQARLVELVVNSDGTLSILSTMLDHLADADPRRDEGIAQLAAIHRELAANIPGAGAGSVLEGHLEDRNVELVLPAPFPL